jgi:hypothetical protein
MDAVEPNQRERCLPTYRYFDLCCPRAVS